MLEGAGTRRQDEYELALFTAWHTAVFHGLAKAGKLHDWAFYRDKAKGVRAPVTPLDGMTRKAERQAQMTQFKKHQQQRTRGPVRRGR